MRRTCGAPGDSWFPKMAGGRKPCGASYDDVERSTVCPHVSLAGGDKEGLAPHPERVDPKWLSDDAEPEPQAAPRLVGPSFFERAVHRWEQDAEFKARVLAVRQVCSEAGIALDKTQIAVALVADHDVRRQIEGNTLDDIPDGLIRAALEVLRHAGFEVRYDTGRGHLEAGILCYPLQYDPEHKNYGRWVAQEPWKEVPDA